MSTFTLVIGNRNYSSWSLRAWLALRVSGVEFDEIVIPLDRPDTGKRVLEHSPAGRVPILRHGALTIWESIAICEYIAETASEARLLPDDPQARAVARAVSAEMHAGFMSLRAALPMNVRADRPGIAIDGAVQSDIDRIAEIWRDCRDRFGAGGPFLFGRFSIADAMFAPVVLRFATYRIDIGPVARAYSDAVLALPAMREWTAASEAEPWTIECEEIH